MLACAREIAVGDVLRMRTGDVKVLELHGTHGGVEATVRPALSVAKSETAGARILWFWPRQSVERLNAPQAPPATLAPRPPKGAAAQKSTGKRQRFEVFKRDGFKCAYCGRSPPEVLLHVDHVIPKAKGGSDDPTNLVTACQDCNLGKAAVPLSVVAPSLQKQADEAKERAEQVAAYSASLAEVRAERERIALALWGELTAALAVPAKPLPSDLRTLRTFLEKLAPDDIRQAIEITARAADRSPALRPRVSNGKAEMDPAFRYFCGVCWRTIRGEGAGRA